MLQSVHFKNFVGFKENRMMDFSGDGPFIFIGENGSGKSSVLEGIRRCLQLKLSTSKSSIFDEKNVSFFICRAETNDKQGQKNVSFGFVSMPGNAELSDEENVRDQRLTDQFKGKNTRTSSQYYKFFISKTDPILIDLITLPPESTLERETKLEVSKSYELTDDVSSKIKHQFFETISESNPNWKVLEKCINLIFGDLLKNSILPSDKLQESLCTLSKQFVFTFPLRSIGPLQWSESDRITSGHRAENYEEAEKRCEIIKYFLIDNGKSFDKDKEREYFQQLTQIENYDFTLNKDGKIILSKDKFALLKTPEGILEAKAFSILISSTQYKTILLEEPDRGMHPQVIQRMIQLIYQEKGNKRVILTTHQKAFITPWTVSDTFIFRRSRSKETRIVSGNFLFADDEDDNMKKKRLLSSHNIPDILFASKVLFYEGPSEHLFLEELRSQLLTRDFFEGDDNAEANNRLKKNLMESTFICMYGRDNHEFYHKISKKLCLAHLILLDRDILNKRQAEEKNKTTRQIRSNYLEKNIFFWLDGALEDMVRAMSEQFPDLKARLAEQKMTFTKDTEVNENSPTRQGEGKRQKKKKQKLFLHEGIKKSNITESVRLLLNYCQPEHDLAAFIKTLSEYA